VFTTEHRPKTRLDRVRQAIQLKHYSIRTEESSIPWINRYSFLPNKRHPSALGRAAIEACLTPLVVDQQVAASTQHRALSALLLLDRDMLKVPLDLPIGAIRAQKPKRVPTVLAKEETLTVIECLSGTH
jgi:hypothetical protein